VLRALPQASSLLHYTIPTEYHRRTISLLRTSFKSSDSTMHMLPVSFLTLMPLAFTSPLPLVEQRDASPGCTEASFGKFSWTVDNFDYHASYIFTTPAHQNSYGFLNFTLSNPALPSAAICSASSSQLSDFFYGNIWYTCNIPDSGHEGTATAFAFNRASGQLDFNQTWSCSDEDAQYPYVALCCSVSLR